MPTDSTSGKSVCLFTSVQRVTQIIVSESSERKFTQINCAMAIVVVSSWIGFGAQFNRGYSYRYPTSVDGCSSLLNSTTLSHDTTTYTLKDSFSDHTTTSYYTTTQNIEEIIANRFGEQTKINFVILVAFLYLTFTFYSRKGVKILYSISFNLLSPIAFSVCLLVGVIVSLITGMCKTVCRE